MWTGKSHQRCLNNFCIEEIMKKIIDLTNKRILIVGASSGIGKQTAITLSEIGAIVTVASRNEQKLIDVVKTLEGSGHNYIVSDVSDPESISSMINSCISQNGPLDGMVYSAGIGPALPIKQSKPETVKKTFDVNFFGFFETIRQITKKGNYNPGLRIVGVSSVASFRGDKTKAIYSATKSAMDSAVRCMAKELADKNICINNVAPAMTDTDLYKKFVDSYGEDSETNRELLKRQYLGVIQPIDVANTIAFLLSPAARAITGITLPVDGGMTTN